MGQTLDSCRDRGFRSASVDGYVHAAGGCEGLSIPAAPSLLLLPNSIAFDSKTCLATPYTKLTILLFTHSNK